MIVAAPAGAAAITTQHSMPRAQLQQRGLLGAAAAQGGPQCYARGAGERRLRRRTMVTSPGMSMDSTPFSRTRRAISCVY